MTYSTQFPRRHMSLGGQPLYATLVSFPVAFFTGALATDIIYWMTGQLVWQNFSAWLLFGGLVVGGLAALVAIVYMIMHRGDRAVQPTWGYLIGCLVVLALAFLNSLIHAGDGWTAVVPKGIVLSAVTVIVMLVTAWLGRRNAHPYDAGVIRHG